MKSSRTYVHMKMFTYIRAYENALTEIGYADPQGQDQFSLHGKEIVMVEGRGSFLTSSPGLGATTLNAGVKECT
jgi:hypothetical protein